MNRSGCDKCGEPQFPQSEPFGQYQACSSCIADIRARCRHSHDFEGRPHYPKVTVRMRCWACAGTGGSRGLVSMLAGQELKEPLSVPGGNFQSECAICAGEGSKSVTYSTEPEPMGDYAEHLDNVYAAADFDKDVRPPGAR